MNNKVIIISDNARLVKNFSCSVKNEFTPIITSYLDFEHTIIAHSDVTIAIFDLTVKKIEVFEKYFILRTKYVYITTLLLVDETFALTPHEQSSELNFYRYDGKKVDADVFKAKLNTLKTQRDVKAIQKKEQHEIIRGVNTLFDNLPGFAFRYVINDKVRMEFVSDGCFALTGYSSAEMLNDETFIYDDLVIFQYRRNKKAKWSEALQSGTAFIDEYEIKTKSGHTRWVYERATPIFDENGKIIAIEGLVIDAARSKRLESELKYMSEYNVHFELPNRAVLFRNLGESLEGDNPRGLLMLINLKDTQNIYRSHGYQYIELLTTSLVNKLKTLETNERKLYYIEHDIYAFFVQNKACENYIWDTFNEIKDTITNTIVREQIRCKVGVTYIKKNELTIEDMFTCARVAAEFASDENDLFSLHIYNEEIKKQVAREEHLKQELFNVAYSEEPHKLRLVFQPLVDLKSGKTVAFEALARYESDVYGPISPVEFIPLVEKNRLAVGFGKKIIDLAISFLQELLHNGISDIPVSVNTSILQLLDPWFIESLLRKLNAAHVPPYLFIIELTESVFATNINLLNERLTTLSKHGILTALDDFGTGFSSLALIEKLRFSTVKIDRLFIQNLTRENMGMTTIPEIIQICHKFGLASLAEGIETIDQYNLLRELGCKYGQGFYMSRPLSACDALDFIKQDKALI